jgi:putative transposase
MAKEKLSRKPYPSDLTDAQWTILEPLIPAAHTQYGGRPREVDRREVVNTIVYLTRSGCQWEMLPHDVLPKSTVYDDFARWRDDGTWATILNALREQTPRPAGREATPSAVCLDRPSVKTTAMGGPERGYDGGQKVKGRTRPLLVETLGLLMVVVIMRAGLAEGVAAPPLLQLIEPKDLPRLDPIFADHTYHNHALHTWMREQRPTWRIAVKTRPQGVKGFTPLEKRWVVERTNAWHGRSRRHSKDDERTPESSAAMIYMSTIHVMLRRLTLHGRPKFHYRSMTAGALKLAS